MEKGAKNQLNGLKMCESPATEFLVENMENLKEMSIYDLDTKDSGFSEDFHEDFDKLVTSPLSLEENEMTMMCFSSPVGKDGFTSAKKVSLATKKRLFVSPEIKSPSAETVFSLKRLKIFDIDQTLDILENEEALEVKTTPVKSERKFLGSPGAAALVPSVEVQKNIVKIAVEKSESDEDLIGDCSKTYALPLVAGSHPDLKCISVETMRDVLEGKYDKVLDSITIVDSRYPYEFEGGHIEGAINLYSKDDYLKLLDGPSKSSSERHILIFHCEFSKERGPNMVRHLRKEDRTRNAMKYPMLNIPEMYVLEGGYKKFFQFCPEYCNPMKYKEMLHPEHAEDMRFFRKKTKSCDETKTCKKSSKSRMVRKFLSDDF